MAENGRSNNSWKKWVFSAVLVALSIVLTRLLSINIGNDIRIGFGRFPIILSGMWYGPFIGMAVGAVSDFLGAIMFTGWNPIITIPAALSGLLPFLFLKLFRVGKPGLGEKNSLKKLPGIIATVILTKILTQGLLMSVILALVYNGFAAFGTFLLTRNIITVSEALVESAVIYVLYTNAAVNRAARTGFFDIV
ncbi:MAG: folate family ECF transporter S component [Clostridia bacterium]|nr:folate family ECF transporter S component [Clostridia bacterium]